MPVLEARDVSKVYREGPHEVAALQGASLTVDRGEIVAIEGPSGSGKTTLLCILGCLLTPTSGRITIDGQKVDLHRPEQLRDLRRRSIGFIFQQFNLFASLTAAENVVYGLNLRGCTGRAARREAERVLDAVGLRERKDFRPRDLSGGQRQRVAVARALAGSPGVILADEPTGNLDTATAAEIVALLREIHNQLGTTVIMVTHDEELARGVSDRVLRLRDGRLLPEGGNP